MFDNFRFIQTVLFLIFVFYLMVEVVISCWKRHSEIKNNMQNLDLTNYIQLIKDFPELKQCKENNKKYSIITIIILFLLFLGVIFLFFISMNYVYVIFWIIIGGIFLLIFAKKADDSVKLYEKIYKGNVINQLLKKNDQNITYESGIGISKTQYDSGNFETYDIFSSEDMIKSLIDNTPFILSDVKTQEKYRDKDGDVHYRTVFSGTVAIANLPKNINAFINILDNRWLSEHNQDYVQIDNTEFEKKYDVFSNNNIIAMRFLTPNVTTAILDLQKQINSKMEIKINYDVIYFRFHGSNLFEPAMKNEKLEAYLAYESILKYNTIKTIITEILKIINKLD